MECWVEFAKKYLKIALWTLPYWKFNPWYTRFVSKSLFKRTAQVQVTDGKSVCPDRSRQTVPMSSLSCIHQTLVRSCPVFRAFFRVSRLCKFVRPTLRRVFTWVWTYRLSVWDLNLGEYEWAPLYCCAIFLSSSQLYVDNNPCCSQLSFSDLRFFMF